MTRLEFLRRNPLVILALLVMGFEAITKGWLSLLAIPSLFVAIPLLVVVQSGAAKLLERGHDPRSISRIATAQLFGLLAAYACLPGVGDTPESLMFGFLMIDGQNPLVLAMWLLSAAGAVVAIISTVAFFRLRGKANAS